MSDTILDIILFHNLKRKYYCAALYSTVILHRTIQGSIVIPQITDKEIEAHRSHYSQDQGHTANK